MNPGIADFVEDKQLLGLSVSPAQRTLLKAIYGLPLEGEERDLWRQCTGRPTYPARPFAEATVIAGARAGKDSRVAATIVCFEAVFGGHERQLARGERGVVVLVAQDQRATKVAFGYIKQYLTGSALLAGQVAEVLASEITLTNGISIACFPCTLRSLRGWSIPVGVLDELGFFRLEGQADSDVEIQASIRRGMVNFVATRLIKISTPYMKSGVLYDDFRRGYGQDDPDLLVWRASSVLMNPLLGVERLEREKRLDPLRFAREYEAEFAEDLEAFLPGAWIDAAVMPGRYELPPRDGVKYVAAVDPSGGGADAFTLALCHAEGRGAEGQVVQDVMKGWAAKRESVTDLEAVVREIATLCHAYDCHTVVGDRYAAGWVREAFRRHGLRYEEPTVRQDGEPHALDKSAGYLEVEPLFAQGHIEILDHPQLVRELKLLERRPRAGGKVSVDHPSGGHDDHANALALAAAQCRQARTAPLAGPLYDLLPVPNTRIPPGITQLGEPIRTGGSGWARARPAGGAVGGQAEWIRRRYR